MVEKNYDKKIFRLLSILKKLDNRGKVRVTNLAEEFNVSERSIQRDFKLLLEVGFPIERNSETGFYCFMEGFNIGKSRLTEKEWALLLSFKEMAGKIGPPFAGLMNSIVQKNLHPPEICDWFYFKMDEPTAVPDIENILSTLIDAIKNKEIITFTYTVYSDYQVQVRPFKITQFSGLWYLVGQDTSDEVIKKYALDRIKKPKGTGKYFASIPDHIDKILDESFNIWFGPKRGKKVLIEVSKDVADYFKRKKWFPNQEIVEDKKDGNLMVSYVVSNYMEILPFLKSWIPHVWVIRPKPLKDMFWKELKKGIERFTLEETKKYRTEKCSNI